MKKINVIALANTFAIIDFVLHPLFHLWGWYFPRSYENVMHEFVIGLNLRVQESFTQTFFVYWVLEAVGFWLLGAVGATLYNKLSNSHKD